MARSPGRIALHVRVAALAACYRPNVQDAGLRCAEAGTACPEGFHCGGDRRCHGRKADVSARRGGRAPGVPIEPLGQQCDPIRQQGCECGRRCNLHDEKLDCVPPGNKIAGDFCNLVSDDCAAGLVCLSELCSPEDADAGQQVGRAIATVPGTSTATACRATSRSRAPSATQLLTACQLPPRTCDPVNATTACGGPLLACYVETTGVCPASAPGSRRQREACGRIFDRCVPGYRCVQQGAVTPRCRQVCRLSGSDCMSASTCTEHRQTRRSAIAPPDVRTSAIFIRMSSPPTTLPRFAYLTPRTLPPASRAGGAGRGARHRVRGEGGGRVVRRDHAPFIDGLGDRLAAWVDHHDHERHADYAGDPRFVLATKAEHGACPEMVTPGARARGRAGRHHRARTSISTGCTPRRSGSSAASSPTPAPTTTRARSTRASATPGPIATRIDRALRAQLPRRPAQAPVVHSSSAA